MPQDVWSSLDAGKTPVREDVFSVESECGIGALPAFGEDEDENELRLVD
ncbi:MAG: hypothetical protein QOE70_1374 [Chthoniobacter sp.]|nr:hypothetical protein [Chthoniobacter sp.]